MKTNLIFNEESGAGINPPIYLGHIPTGAKCLALIMEDYDSPEGSQTHWLVWNIPLTHHIKEREIHGIEGINDFQISGYTGPLSHGRIHRYVFKVYGLKQLLDLSPNSSITELQRSMSPHVIAFGEFSGLY
jgi:Raf kinase inhibitor-like YbhB/YbcL family protein